MCGIAGYSVQSGSSLDRTLAAQALLAAIAERGADAVGYAYRRPEDTYATVVKQRTPASQLLERITVPAEATQLLVHVRDYTKGHPSINANNHPVRHGPVIGIHNGIITNDDELLAPHSCARAEAKMTVDSEAIFALAAHSGNDPRALEHLRGALATGWLDERRAGRRVPRTRQRPPALARRGARRRLLRVDEARTRHRRAVLPGEAAQARGESRARGSRSPAARSSGASASGRISTTSSPIRFPPCGRPASATSA